MQLALDHISKKVGPEQWLYDMSLAPRASEVTVLLGTTQAGKTSLMRIMAGLDVPTQGRVMVDGKNVTGTAVCERNVAMVYQQFINYLSLKVADNIASPLVCAVKKALTARCAPRRSTCISTCFLTATPPNCPGASSSVWRGPGRWPRARH